MVQQNDDNVPFSMVQEACDSFDAKVLADGRTEVRIIVPPRFAEIWLVKLSELRFTLADLHSPNENKPT